MNEAYDIVVDILTGKFQVAGQDLLPGTTLEEVDLDSLSMVEFALTLRERAGVHFGDDEFTADTTLGGIAEAIRVKRGVVDAEAPAR